MEPKPSPVRGNVKNKIFVVFIGMAALLVGLVSGCSQDITGLEDAEKAAMREVREIAAVSASLLNVYMDARVTDMLVGSAACKGLREALTSTEARSVAHRTLEEWLKVSGAYEAILLLDKKGVCLASAPEVFLNQDFSGDKAFKSAAAGKPTVTDAHKSDVLTSLDFKSKGWTAAIAVPIKSDKELPGVLISYLKWSRLQDLIRTLRVGETGYVYELDRHNRVIMHPSEDYYGISLLDSRANLPVIDDAVKKKLANQRYEHRIPEINWADARLVGFAYPGGFGKFGGLGWTVVASGRVDELVGAPPWAKFFRK